MRNASQITQNGDEPSTLQLAQKRTHHFPGSFISPWLTKRVPNVIHTLQHGHQCLGTSASKNNYITGLQAHLSCYHWFKSFLSLVLHVKHLQLCSLTNYKPYQWSERNKWKQNEQNASRSMCCCIHWHQCVLIPSLYLQFLKQSWFHICRSLSGTALSFLYCCKGRVLFGLCNLLFVLFYVVHWLTLPC